MEVPIENADYRNTFSVGRHKALSELRRRARNAWRSPA